MVLLIGSVSWHPKQSPSAAIVTSLFISKIPRGLSVFFQCLSLPSNPRFVVVRYVVNEVAPLAHRFEILRLTVLRCVVKMCDGQDDLSFSVLGQFAVDFFASLALVQPAFIRAFALPS